MESGAEIVKTMQSPGTLMPKEKISFAGKIVLATNFLYKNYHALVPGQQRDIADTDGIRGDLAIQSINKAISQGVQVVASDGGSSDEFLSAIKAFEDQEMLTVVRATQAGRAPQRRAAFKRAIQFSGKEAIVYFQPEKDSLMDYLVEITKPILDGSADVVVPSRVKELFEKHYTSYMKEIEPHVNKTYNYLMHRNNLLPEGENFDWFFGPVVFKNDPEIIAYFLKEYGLRFPIKSRIGAQPNPEMHSDGHYFPIIEALFRGKRVVSVQVPFIYPKLQRLNEELVSQEDRRLMDADAYRLEAVHFLACLRGDKRSKIQLVEDNLKFT